jgi:hypothetical protein
MAQARIDIGAGRCGAAMSSWLTVQWNSEAAHCDHRGLQVEGHALRLAHKMHRRAIRAKRSKQ